jgi:hypothetical protein
MPQKAAMAFTDLEPLGHIAPWEDMSDWELGMLWSLIPPNYAKKNQVIEINNCLDEASHTCCF